MKTCSNADCTQPNPQSLLNFYSDKKGTRSQCKTCVSLKKKAYFQKHRERELDKLKQWKIANPDRVREGNLRNNYGITLGDYNSMLNAQRGLCAICGTSEPGGGNSAFCVDHSHKTQKVRSLLCFTCNIALGMLKDKSELVSKIAAYLVKHEETF